MTSARPSTTADASLGRSVRSVLAPSPLSRGALAGAAAELGLGAIDLAAGPGVVLTALLALPPLVVALTGRWGDTAIVALLGLAIAIAVGAPGEGIVVVAGSGVAAMAGALVRAGSLVALERFRLLVGVADASDGAPGPDALADRIAGVLVPDFAGEASIGEPEPHALAVALRARGQEIGALNLAGRAYSDSDRRFAEVLAGRVALALDNALLTEAREQLGAVVENLAEAVTVNDATGQITYANQAAVDLLRVDRVEDLLEAAPGEVMDRFAVYDEDGRPLGLADLPAARVVAGEQGANEIVVRNVVRATGEERWLLNKVTLLRGPRGEVRRVINVIEDVSTVKRAERAQRLLARASESFAASLDETETLRRVAEVAVPDLADCAAVELPTRGGRFHEAAASCSSREAAAKAPRLRERYTGEPLHDEELGSLIAVPVQAGSESLGRLLLTSAARAFAADEVELARELGRRAGGALLNARLYGRRTAIAQTLQHGLLPPRLPDVPGWSAAVFYRPAGEFNEVGGDFYDIFEGPDGWMVVIGDVAGHGAEAATQTSLARFTARTAAELTGDVSRSVARLNETLRREEGLPLCTVVCASLAERGDGTARVTMASAGHPPPLLVRGDRVTPIGDPGTIAGAFDGEAWPEATVDIAPGDVLVLYTDGVLDAVGESDRFGEARLRAGLGGRDGSVEERLAALRGELESFERGPQRDDTTVLVLEYRGTGAPSSERAAAEQEAPG